MLLNAIKLKGTVTITLKGAVTFECYYAYRWLHLYAITLKDTIHLNVITLKGSATFKINVITLKGADTFECHYTER